MWCKVDVLYFFCMLSFKNKLWYFCVFVGRKEMYGERLGDGFLESIIVGVENLFLF